MPKLPIPITLITGYLGSGKTTLVNEILRNAGGRKMAVIVNDIGTVNIDAELIAKGGVVQEKDDSLVALQNGCICCTLKANLIDQLADLVNSGKFDHILIEASGICEPIPIAQTLVYMEGEFARRKMPKFYYLDAIVSVVDALRLKDEFIYGEGLTAVEDSEESIESLVVQQIEFCDIILLNKASEVTPEELRRVEKAIRGIQRKAKIVPCDYAKVDLSSILDTHAFDAEAISSSAAWIEEFDSWENEDRDHRAHEDHEEHEDHDHDEHEHGHRHHHHHDHGVGENDEHGHTEEYDIVTTVYYRREPIDRNKFVAWAQENAHHIIRAKGIVYFADEPGRSYLYESAGRQRKLTDNGLWFSSTHSQADIDNFRKEDPYYAHDYDPVYKDKLIKLVFIGQNLDTEAITDELDAI